MQPSPDPLVATTWGGKLTVFAGVHAPAPPWPSGDYYLGLWTNNVCRSTCNPPPWPSGGYYYLGLWTNNVCRSTCTRTPLTLWWRLPGAVNWQCLQEYIQPSHQPSRACWVGIRGLRLRSDISSSRNWSLYSSISILCTTYVQVHILQHIAT